MRRRRLTLQEKIFVIKSYYGNHEISPLVQDQFNKEYKVRTTEKIIKTIDQVVISFEKTGSVTSEIYLESGTLIKHHEEDVEESLPKAKSERMEVVPDYPEISIVNLSPVKKEVVVETSSDYYTIHQTKEQLEEEAPATDDLPFDMESLGHVSNDDDANSSDQDLEEQEEEEEQEDEEEQEAPVAPKKRIRDRRKKKPSTDPNDPDYDITKDPNFAEPLACQLCDKVFNTRKALNNHKDVHRPYEKYVECTICQRPCRNNHLRISHELIHISSWEREWLSCELCDKKYRNISVLQRHIREHSSGRGRTKSICDICGKVSGSANALKSHMRTHTGEKPYKCDRCPSTFAATVSLQIHMRRHTGERPYKCEVCGKGFADGSTLRVHHRQHTGESPYACQFCGKRCKQMQNLRSHIRHMHKGEVV